MNYKKQAASEAKKLIQPQQVIGLGAGSTVAHLADEMAADTSLAETVCFVSSCTETTKYIVGLGLKMVNTATLAKVDIYFDGCDQLDAELNALKSGGGIHTDEKVLADMATEFIILGDESKYSDKLTTTYPLTIEVVPGVIGAVSAALKKNFDTEKVMVRKNAVQENLLTKRNCVLLEVKFTSMPELPLLNQIKLWPGIIGHSLFYKLATGAIICGPAGIKHLRARSSRITYSLT